MARLFFDDFYTTGKDAALSSYNSAWRPYHTGSTTTLTVVADTSYVRVSGTTDDAGYAYRGIDGTPTTYSSLIIEGTVKTQNYNDPDRQQATLLMGTDSTFSGQYGAGYAFGVNLSDASGSGCLRLSMYRLPTSAQTWPVLAAVNVPVPGYPKDYKLRFYNIGNLLIGEGYVLNEPTTYRKISAVDATYSKSAMMPGVHIWMNNGTATTQSPRFYDWSFYDSSNPQGMVIRNAKVENATFKIR